MKIYEIGTGYTPIPATMGAATEIVVEGLTRSLITKGIDAKIVDIASDDRTSTDLPIIEVPVPKKFRSTDVQLGLMHKLKRVVYSIALARKLKKIVLTSKKKVVLHFHNQYNLFFFAKLTPQCIRSKCYIIYTNHSYVWHGEWSEIEKTVHKRYFQEIICMKYADKVFVLNEIALKNIEQHIGIPSIKLCLIDNGVNTEVYHPVQDPEKIKKEAWINGEKIFIEVGSVCDRKNQLGALKLLTPLMKKDPTIVFAYAGGIISPEYQNSITEYANKNGLERQVIYAGELQPGESLNEFYNLAEAMVFPSKAEGFSLVILEAMSAGVPVIINEDLEFKLSDQCLKFKDQDSFEKVIEEKIFDRENHEALKKQVRESIIQNYSWDVIAKEYLKEIREN